MPHYSSPNDVCCSYICMLGFVLRWHVKSEWMSENQDLNCANKCCYSSREECCIDGPFDVDWLNSCCKNEVKEDILDVSDATNIN